MNTKRRTLLWVLSLCTALCVAAFPARALFFREGSDSTAVQTFAKSAAPGDIVTFSLEDFESRVTGTQQLESIVLSRLPEEAAGVLRLAGRELAHGESISAESLSALSFAPAAEGDVHTSFSFIPVFSRTGATGDSVNVALNLSAEENTAPIARDLSVETYPDLPLCGAFSALDPDGDACTFTLLSQPEHGTVTLTDTGFCYTSEGRTGEDVFTYQAVDAYGNPSAEASVTVQVRKRPSGSDISYTDMAQSTSHYQAVRLAEEGVLTGERLGAACFLKPELSVSRAEFVALTAAATELPLPTAAVSTGLADNDAIPTWAQPYVAAAVNSGIVYGQKGADGNHSFRAADGITRAEAASIVQRAAHLTTDGRTLTFADTAEIPEWAVSSVATVSAAGILPAYSDNTFRPNEVLTREQAVDVLYKTMCFLQEKGLGAAAD